VWEPRTLLALVPLGALWTLVAATLLWRFGLAGDERTQFGREFGRRQSLAPVPEV
jgi:hypothetical protein